MTIRIEFIADDVVGRVHSIDEPLSTWTRVKDAILVFDPDATIAPRSITAEWRAITAAAPEFAAIRSRFGVAFEYDDEARRRLLLFRDETRQVAALRDAQVVSPKAADVTDLLQSRGFVRRRLTAEQTRDAVRMLGMRHGANFSVPGAGKTTVALAVHLLGLPPKTAFVVIAPKNAFSAWDEVLEDCLEPVGAGFTRVSGTPDVVRDLLLSAGDGARLLVSYDQLRISSRLVAHYLMSHPSHLVLDESHRIKAGTGSQRGQAALSLSQLAIRRDVLSGTPLPNGIDDLSPQLEFLWPGQGLGGRITNASRPRDVLAPFYVRTTKHELGLKPIEKVYEAVSMADSQVALYSVVKDELLKIETGIRANPTNVDLDAARRSVLSLLQIASNPVMYVNRVTAGAPLTYPYDNRTIEALFAAVYEEGDSPKVQRACELARDLAARGERTVIWSTFTHNVERLAVLLEDLGATFIHGGVDTGDRNDPATREYRIAHFHDPDKRCMVLVANPAACGEGISLHKVCHYAVYVDRSFNAGHFLQSIDRIHRLGLPPETRTHVHILESVAPQSFGSVDYSVRRRLVAKLRDMNAVLEDLDLQRLMFDEETADAPLDFDIQREDIIDVIDQLRGLAPEPGEEQV